MGKKYHAEIKAKSDSFQPHVDKSLGDHTDWGLKVENCDNMEADAREKVRLAQAECANNAEIIREIQQKTEKGSRQYTRAESEYNDSHVKVVQLRQSLKKKKT